MDGLVASAPVMDWEAPDLESSWKRFMEHATFVFNGPLNDKEEEERCAYLMIWVGEKGRRIYQTWNMTADDKKKLNKYTENFEKYVKPRTNTVYNRYKFGSRIQNEGESFDQFVTDLQILVKDCAYDKPDEMVRDRVVFGVRNSKVREKFINIGSDLTLDKTLEIARTYEISKTQTRSMNFESENVNAIQKGSRPKMKLSQLKITKCTRCGKTHRKDQCPAIGQQCSKCRKYDHFAAVCRTKMDSKPKHRQKRQQQKQINQIDSDSSDELYVGMVIEMSTDKNVNVNALSSDWLVETDINGKSVCMQLDTGARCNVMSQKTLKKIGIKGCQEKIGGAQVLRSYSGHKLPVTGTRTLQCKINGQVHNIKFHIVDMPAETILGCQSCEELNLVRKVNAIPDNRKDIEKQFPKLFSGLGKLPGEHKIIIDKSVEPVVHAPRKVPVALKEKVKKELESMEKQGVIVKQDKPTEWVNSMVTVVKPNGKIRICMDPRDLNKAIKRPHHPMKTIDEILPHMSNAKYFSKVDASCGFWQCALDKASQELCTMNTPFGRYSFTRLPYGIKSAPEVYQKLISELIQDIDGCESIVDDIVIWGKTKSEHDCRLKKVLTRLNENNLRLNRDKCEFSKRRITYVGHELTEEGLKPDEEKVRAVREMKKPENVAELQTFLGFVNYLAKFIENMSEKSAPLRTLLQKETQWHWDREQEEAFNTLKEAVVKAPVLKYYDQHKPVTLSVDASSKGLGAVILQNGQPVAYASRALTEAQQNYAQIEKEALAIAYGCTKFHQYIFGKEIHVETDHRPLQAIFKKPLFQTPPRLQRILMSLQRYDLNVEYKPGKEMFISDCLSRAFLNETKEDLNSEDLTINLLTYLPVSEEKRKTFQKETYNDREMKELKKIVECGWPERQEFIPTEIRVYWNFRDEITCIDGMMFKGHKLIVPKSLRLEMLKLIHEAHTGIVKCKARARESLFWPGMANDVETTVASCEICMENQKRNPKEPLIKTEIPTRPWEKVSVDLFHFRGNNYLLSVDRYSSWPEIAKLDNLSSQNTITYMKSQFSRYGIPDEIYSDNGVQFTSHSFIQFRKDYGFKHVTSSPTYAQSNGLAERGVQTVKSLLKKARDPYKALMIYRDTPLESTGLSPAQMFLGRRLKTTLPVTTPLLEPSQPDSKILQKCKEKVQSKQKEYFDNHCGKVLSKLQSGESIVMRRDEQWEPAVVVRQHESPRSYVVKNKNGQQYRRNRKHLRPSKAKFANSEPEDDFCDFTSTSDRSQQQTAESAEPPPPVSPSVVITRSGRSIKPPSKYKDFEL